MNQNQKKLLRTKDVCNLLRISVRQFYRLNQLKDFPHARLIGKTKLWLEVEVWGWVEAQIVPASEKTFSSPILAAPNRGRPSKRREVEARVAASSCRGVK